MNAPFRLYRVTDDDGALFLVARSLSDAVCGWRDCYAEAGVTADDEPNEIQIIAESDEFFFLPFSREIRTMLAAAAPFRMASGSEGQKLDEACSVVERLIPAPPVPENGEEIDV